MLGVARTIRRAVPFPVTGHCPMRTGLSRSVSTGLALSLVGAILLASSASGQGFPGDPTPRPAMINASSDPLLAPFRFRSIGPASMGGRIDDVAVSESDPSIIYIGY